MRNLSKHLSLAVLLLCAASRVGAQNPIVQTACTPDPAPKVLTGTHDLYLVYKGTGENLFDVDWWQLVR